MTVYRLPSSQPSGYRGKYPTRIAEVSYSPNARDAEGAKYVYVRTNDGWRYTISLDCLNRDARTIDRPRCGQFIGAVIKPGKIVHNMDRPAYDAWLSKVRAEREGE